MQKEDQQNYQVRFTIDTMSISIESFMIGSLYGSKLSTLPASDAPVTVTPVG